MVTLKKSPKFVFTKARGEKGDKKQSAYLQFIHIKRSIDLMSWVFLYLKKIFFLHNM